MLLMLSRVSDPVDVINEESCFRSCTCYKS